LGEEFDGGDSPRDLETSEKRVQRNRGVSSLSWVARKAGYVTPLKSTLPKSSINAAFDKNDTPSEDTDAC
jgi:hypothetical protein